MRDTEELDLLEAAAERFAETRAARGGAGAASALWSDLVDLGAPGLSLGADFGGPGFGAPGVVRLARALGRHGIALDGAVALVVVPELLAQSAQTGAIEAMITGGMRIALRASALPGATGTAVADLAIGPPEPTHLLSADGGLTALTDGDGTPVCLTDGQTALRLTRNGAAPALSGRPLILGLIAAAATNLGAMERLFAITREHLMLREQFGRPLAQFQTLQFRLVDLSIRIAETAALVLAAADADPESARCAELAQAAWIRAAESARDCASEAIQLHGAIGMTAECGISVFVRRILTTEQLWGNAQSHLPAFRQRSALFA